MIPSPLPIIFDSENSEFRIQTPFLDSQDVDRLERWLAGLATSNRRNNTMTLPIEYLGEVVAILTFDFGLSVKIRGV